MLAARPASSSSSSAAAAALKARGAAGGGSLGGLGGGGGKGKGGGSKAPDLDDLIERRDFAGAAAVVEFRRQQLQQQIQASSGNDKATTSLKLEDSTLLHWLAWCSLHAGDHARALDGYRDLLSQHQLNTTSNNITTSSIRASIAVCLYYISEHREALREAERAESEGDKDVRALAVRVQLACAARAGDEEALMKAHAKLDLNGDSNNSVHDQLALAGVHYGRAHFQEATDAYKRLLLAHRDYVALNVYVALCYCRLDYYDVSLEILSAYLQAHNDSPAALNLKACNHFRLYNGRAAEAEIRSLLDNDNNNNTDTTPSSTNPLVRHNLVVFRNGHNALQVLPTLMESGVAPPEARLNLTIQRLRAGEVAEAHAIVKDLEPATPQEYILKGVVHAALGQDLADKGVSTNTHEAAEHLRLAQQYFQLVGASASECDTIPGRQCMASCFFLLKQFDDVLIYLKSVKTYFYNDDDFNWNYGMAKACVQEWQEAEETLLLVQNERYKQEYAYVTTLVRCHIMNGRQRLAWDLYIRMDASDDSFSILQLIANDCYKMGQFFYAAKAFDVLERTEYWEGKRGACAGAFQAVVAGREGREQLREIIGMLRNNAPNPQADQIARVIRKWAKDVGLKIA
eukprot:jgi/Chlat1/2626/Chrsp178S00156